jgi:hypothetical protein
MILKTPFVIAPRPRLAANGPKRPNGVYRAKKNKDHKSKINPNMFITAFVLFCIYGLTITGCMYTLYNISRM